jgi:hypothetical protein
MDKYILEIQNAIEKAAIDGTLTKDAIGQFNSLIEHNEALQTQAIQHDKTIQRQEVQIKQMTTELGMAHGLNKVAAEMEAGVILREQAITTLELEAKHQGERVKDHKEMFSIVFRNSIIRRQALGQNENYVESSGASRSTYPVKEDLEEKTE